jgi:hypothetical protein
MGRLQEASDALDEIRMREYAALITRSPLGTPGLISSAWLERSLYMRRAVLTHWLYEQGIHCPVTTALLDELERFIRSGKPGPHRVGIHTLHHTHSCIYLVPAQADY